MRWLLFASAVLFIASTGSMIRHRAINSENSAIGCFILLLFTILPFLMLVVAFSSLFGVMWYWALIMAIIANAIFWNMISSICSDLFVHETVKELLLLFAPGYIQRNTYIVDALISFAFGLMLYFIAV